ncbi:type IV secretion system protein VirB3 (plasmid) [Agrobacterium rosae]|uniref:VirB3 family type IV secretion system protein n=1 Tax=Agrobacterium rosae TaxID=1972867 RepID=A0ABU4W532_9HYPH|nr:VirB3 family type IV secretion system protein [Agrobacterium rosae]MDX8331875.1 VirB3 family type IV secretion system protein [Agrobacterium rosae]
MNDDAPDVEPLIVPLTRPPMYFGVDIIVFVLNGLVGIVLFIATGNFLAPLVVLPIHFIGLYLCQRDVHIVRVAQVFLSMRRAIRNRKFWKSVSYSP